MIRKYLTPERSKSIDEIEICFSRHDYVTALNLTNQIIDSNTFDLDNESDFFYAFELAGYLVDINEVLIDLESVRKGIGIMLSVENIYQKFITESSYYFIIIVLQMPIKPNLES